MALFNKHHAREIHIFIIMLVLMVKTTILHAQQCSPYIKPTSEVGQYLVQNNGTVIDNRNQLMWTHCSLGQLARKQQCTGDPRKLTWKDANEKAHEISLAGFVDWRLPSVQELSLLVELRCEQPAVNLELFPSTRGEDYWTTTEFVNNLESAWLVHFGYGENHVGLKSGKASVRYVRSIKADKK